MKRVPIRDNRSKNEVKPRVFDYIVTDDGIEMIEAKGDKGVKTIRLDDCLGQIQRARNNK